MNTTQTAARAAMERFVTGHGGDVAEIRTVGQAYHWTAPDGREARIGWV